MSQSIHCPYCRGFLKQSRDDYIKEEHSFVYLIQYSCEKCEKKFYQITVLTEDQPKPVNNKL